MKGRNTLFAASVIAWALTAACGSDDGWWYRRSLTSRPGRTDRDDHLTGQQQLVHDGPADRVPRHGDG